jgi:hypothetical protein
MQIDYHAIKRKFKTGKFTKITSLMRHSNSFVKATLSLESGSAILALSAMWALIKDFIPYCDEIVLIFTEISKILVRQAF